MNFITQEKMLYNAALNSKIKFVVVTGGVCSSIGKGILIASLGVILKNAGYSVSVLKWDPYLNVDPGTMSPLVHGEVFVTQDGTETDLDLGHYERLIDVTLKKSSSVTSGQIYQEVLSQERQGKFLGKCIQLVPHVVNVAKRRLLEFALEQNADFVLLEIGGTVGDMESEVFLEAVRQLKMELGSDHLMHTHLSLVPFLEWTGEVKTKPTQHSVMELKRLGLVPDALFLRADKAIEQSSVDKLAMMCGLNQEYIFQVLTFKPVFRTFISLDEQNVGKKIQEYFKMNSVKSSNLQEWAHFIAKIDDSKEILRIGLIAKYVGSNDPYISVIEAINAAAYYFKYRVELVIIEAELLSKEADSKESSNAWNQLKTLGGIVVPGGFDARGVEGKILAAQWARENNIPYLGLCLGMQVMIIEAARSLLCLPAANSTEFNRETDCPVVCMMDEQKDVVHKGATMRLGSYRCSLSKGTRAYEVYQKETILERHRHRYEVNNTYKDDLAQVGVVFSGINEDMNLVEISEIKDHIFMVGAQFHPEFQSSPLRVHPLFKGFIDAVKEKNR